MGSFAVQMQGRARATLTDGGDIYFRCLVQTLPASILPASIAASATSHAPVISALAMRLSLTIS